MINNGWRDEPQRVTVLHEGYPISANGVVDTMQLYRWLSDGQVIVIKFKIANITHRLPDDRLGSIISFRVVDRVEIALPTTWAESDFMPNEPVR